MWKTEKNQSCSVEKTVTSTHSCPTFFPLLQPMGAPLNAPAVPWNPYLALPLSTVEIFTIQLLLTHLLRLKITFLPRESSPFVMSPIRPQHYFCLFLEMALHILKDHFCAAVGLHFSGLYPPPFVHKKFM